MRLPPFQRYTRCMQLLGALLSGMLIGAAILNTLHIAKFQHMYNVNRGLQEQLEQYEQDIRNLNYYKSQHTVIKSIKLRIENGSANEQMRARLDELTESELIKRVKEHLSIFLGKSIYDIDSDARLARNLLKSMVYRDVYGKDYTIELKTVLLVDNVLQIWMTVKSYARPPS
ncbi:hypothetical protein [Paenibacillus chungangensis]|uniref:Sporulation membrane protein YtrI C-terminal domain-containing protein n=1 Tax=Paenibacillus chungangensis TaxID=696535 RepID=A0ABW3HXL3_9BACL